MPFSFIICNLENNTKQSMATKDSQSAYTRKNYTLHSMTVGIAAYKPMAHTWGGGESINKPPMEVQEMLNSETGL